jgi:hypothetical protein
MAWCLGTGATLPIILTNTYFINVKKTKTPLNLHVLRHTHTTNQNTQDTTRYPSFVSSSRHNDSRYDTPLAVIILKLNGTKSSADTFWNPLDVSSELKPHRLTPWSKVLKRWWVTHSRNPFFFYGTVRFITVLTRTAYHWTLSLDGWIQSTSTYRVSLRQR